MFPHMSLPVPCPEVVFLFLWTHFSWPRLVSEISSLLSYSKQHSSCFPLSFINFFLLGHSHKHAHMLLFLPSLKKKTQLFTAFHLSVTVPFIFFSLHKTVASDFPSLQFLSFHFCDPLSRQDFALTAPPELLRVPCRLWRSVQGELSVLILLDLSKSFDSGNHDFVKHFHWLLGTILSSSAMSFADSSASPAPLYRWQAPGMITPWSSPPLRLHSHHR